MLQIRNFPTVLVDFHLLSSLNLSKNAIQCLPLSIGDIGSLR